MDSLDGTKEKELLGTSGFMCSWPKGLLSLLKAMNLLKIAFFLPLKMQTMIPAYKPLSSAIVNKVRKSFKRFKIISISP